METDAPKENKGGKGLLGKVEMSRGPSRICRARKNCSRYREEKGKNVIPQQTERLLSKRITAELKNHSCQGEKSRRGKNSS